MLAFPFDDSIMSAWNGGDTLANVSKIFSKLNIMTYLPGVSFNTFLIMLYALIVLIILVLVDIVYVSYSFSKKRFRFTWPLIVLAKLVPLFVTIFFLPITETLLSVVRCGSISQSDPQQYMQSFPDVVCWKGWHLFHAAITLLFTSLFVFISSVVALALFEPRMVSKKLTARQNSTGEVVFIMNKIICQLIFSFTPFKDKWVYSVMLFGLSGWLYWIYNMNDPFYNKKASKFFRIVSSYYFWTNFMLLVSQLLSPVGFNGGLVIWISGLPFIGIIIGFEHKSNIDQLFSFNLKFKSGEQLEGHLRYVLQLLENQKEDKNSCMLVIGYI